MNTTSPPFLSNKLTTINPNVTKQINNELTELTPDLYEQVLEYYRHKNEYFPD